MAGTHDRRNQALCKELSRTVKRFNKTIGALPLWVIWSVGLTIAIGLQHLPRYMKPTAAVVPNSTPAACDPGYPTICLRSAPDLNCGDIPQYGDFPVRQPDPHRLDGDKNGWGCEAN